MKNLSLKIGCLFCILWTISTMNITYGQNVTTQEKLMNKTWKLQQTNIDNLLVTIKYTSEKEIKTVTYKKDQHSISNSYYLSNEVNWKFNEQEIGKTKEGKYIIINMIVGPQGNEYEEVDILEILQLTNTTLKIKVVKNGTVLEYKSK